MDMPKFGRAVRDGLKSHGEALIESSSLFSQSMEQSSDRLGKTVLTAGMEISRGMEMFGEKSVKAITESKFVRLVTLLWSASFFLWVCSGLISPSGTLLLLIAIMIVSGYPVDLIATFRN